MTEILADFMRAHAGEIDEAIAQHGITTKDIAVPEYMRLVYVDEVEG